MSDFHGRFIWYELMTPDVGAAKAFYGKVVGWNAQDMSMDAMTYTVLDADGVGVAGAMPLTEEARARGVPPNWTGYVAVDDVDASAAQVKTLGGTVIHAPMDIPGIGRFAVIADPAGAVVAIMTPAPLETPRPPVVPGTPGHPTWHELYAADPAEGFGFYEALFGWSKVAEFDMGPPMGIYQLFGVGDHQLGGMMKKPQNIPAPAWIYYVQATGIDAAAERVKAAGGQLLMGPMEVPSGAWVLQATDPAGAVFALIGSKET